MSSPLDLKLFKDRGFLDFGVTVASRRRHDDATVASLWRHGDASESESESETEKNPRKKTARPASLAARGIADDIAAMVNERHRTKRAATATLIRAVEILLLAGHGAEDILLVVRHRLKNEDWFHPNRYGAESLIRRDKFPSALQIAKESKPRPITSTSIDEGGWEY
ncbi:MAG: hypothetical protein FJX72_11970 [Armatimonadetes bacterium]|nr:hypothetical protein [Armatimonadota bacterium]